MAGILTTFSSFLFRMMTLTMARASTLTVLTQSLKFLTLKSKSRAPQLLKLRYVPQFTFTYLHVLIATLHAN